MDGAIVRLVVISIHALRKESDPPTMRPQTKQSDFNPRSP